MCQIQGYLAVISMQLLDFFSLQSFVPGRSLIGSRNLMHYYLLGNSASGGFTEIDAVMIFSQWRGISYLIDIV